MINKNYNVTLALMLYVLFYIICVFSNIESKEFMTIDANSIISSLEKLTTVSFYNMNDTYHSQFYGWTYFSLNFIIIILAKFLGITSDISINLILKSTLFIIGGLSVYLFSVLSKSIFNIKTSFILTLFFIVNPVTAHYFNEIHPEMLGTMFQLSALIILTLIIQRNKTLGWEFYLAVIFLSLSGLSKQAYIIVNSFVAISFFVIYYRQNEKFKLIEFSKVILYSLSVFFIVSFVIHPYAFFEFSKFYEAQKFISAEHSQRNFKDVVFLWFEAILNNPLVMLNCLLVFSLYRWKKLPLIYCLSVIFSFGITALFVYKSRLWVSDKYFFPLYIFYLFNVCFFIRTIFLNQRVTKNIILFLLFTFFVSNTVESLYIQQKRFFDGELRTKNVAWDYLKELNSDLKIAYSPDIAMPRKMVTSGCHAWQGCSDYDALTKFDPDLVIFSPNYPYYNSDQFEKYVVNNAYSLIKTISMTNDDYLYCGNSKYSDYPLYIFDLLSISKQVTVCSKSYMYMVTNYLFERKITGDSIEIYKKRK